SDTIGNVSRAVGGLTLPNLGRLGLGHLTAIAGVPPDPAAQGFFGKMQERSRGKDTITGHWEMMGAVLTEGLATFPKGFPAELVEAFVHETGAPGVLGNVVASGTVIIQELGEEHVRTGKPIVYTSADSVFQIATHKRAVPLERLYEWCEAARALLTGEHAVGRVVARPFDGEPGSFHRTKERRDYALPPAGPTILEAVQKAGVRTLGVGKIEDIFSRQGLDDSDHTGDNQSSLDATARFLHRAEAPTLVFTNLVDFDMLYGHRRDVAGYGRCLEELDARLPEVVAELGEADWLFLTADHGCDPTAPGTDHTRELAPMVAFSPGGTAGVRLADRDTFADLGATVADLFGVQPVGPGRSFADDLA
ncbi:MAG TPA: phosphopentomutase, partial [Actinomycetota bacterium]|nr:phosphopentomutase [Actinomycetota bacterium]